jgi:hypothetical protein
MSLAAALSASWRSPRVKALSKAENKSVNVRACSIVKLPGSRKTLPFTRTGIVALIKTAPSSLPLLKRVTLEAAVHINTVFAYEKLVYKQIFCL